MGLLTGKKALVFGLANNKSIAYGITKALIEHGAEVGLSYANEVLEKRVKPIAEELGIKFCEECDLANDEAVAKLFEKIKAEFGTFDILVHSVAFAPRETLTGRFVETSREAFLTTMNISVYTLMKLAHEAEPLMNEDGSIMTLTYYGGEKMIVDYNVMGVAKAALDSTVRYLATDLGSTDKHIRVNAISAGPMKTLSSSAVGSFKALYARAINSAPLKRYADIDDVGNAAVYLGSDLAKNVTGEVLHVDAGLNSVGIAGLGDK
ncbi:MAG: enoyl-ACP reductase [Deferribacteraceae bacterium]|jgi:enoyl-[acyl-carrier protein] reductase I|nr:enoyl-ACP reductase [Deferribacteraceae bacterium]